MTTTRRHIEFKGQSKHMFATKLIAGILGMVGYIYTGGTFLFGLLAFLFFSLLAELATTGYHRWVSHNAIKPTFVGKCILWFCMLSVGSLRPSTYAIIHRVHHKFSDTEQDPHPTALGLFNCLTGNYDRKKVTFSVPVLDLYRKKEINFVDKYFWYLYLATLIIFAAIDPHLAMLSFPFLVLRYHVHSAVFNYIAHGGKGGTGPINLPLFPGLLFWGEHLHLNHHLRQTSANYGTISKFNFDYMYRFLRFFKLIKD